MAFALRKAAKEDAEAIGALLFAAFDSLDRQHGQRPFYASEASAMAGAHAMLARSDAFGVVAVGEADNALLGAAFAQRIGVRGGAESVLGIGPVGVAPDAQSRGLGRALLHGVGAHTALRARMTQDAFNNASLTLYLSCGFEFAAPLAFLSRSRAQTADTPSSPPAVAGLRVARETVADDAHAAARLHARLLGFRRPTPFDALVVRNAAGECVAYVQRAAAYPHGCAESFEAHLCAIDAWCAALPEAASLEIAVPCTRSRTLLALRKRRFRQVRPVNLLLRGDWSAHCDTEFYLSTASY